MFDVRLAGTVDVLLVGTVDVVVDLVVVVVSADGMSSVLVMVISTPV